MMAHISNLKPGKMFWSIKDPHIYINQIDGINEQINRYNKKGSLKAPSLWLNPDVKNFYDFDNSQSLNDIEIVEYKHMGNINFEITQ